MDSKQQKQQVDRQCRKEGEEEWEDEGGEEEELVAHARELDFGTHCLPCQGNLVFFITFQWKASTTLGLALDDIFIF